MITLLGVILSAAIAGSVSLWQVQLSTDREREARRIERDQTRQDVRDAFQRDTILALQDAIAAFLRMAVDVNIRSRRI